MFSNRVAFLILAAVCVIALSVQPIAAFDKPVTPPGQSGNNPGNGGTPPGQDKDKDKDKDKDQSGDQEQEQEQEQEGQDIDDLDSIYKGKAKITWLTEKSEISDDLISEGEAILQFVVSADLEEAGVWLTPSLSPYLEADPPTLEQLVADTDDPYEITLRLKEGVELTNTVGGTLHIVELKADGTKGRTYSRPLGIKVHPKSEGDEEAPEPIEDTDDTEIVVTDAASFIEGPIAPLEIVTIFGLQIGPVKTVPLEINEEGAITDYLADVQVLFDGVAAAILAASQNQVNVVVPYSVAGKSEVNVIVTYQDMVSAEFTVGVVPEAPAIFTMNGLGHGYAAAYDALGQIIGPENPAEPDTIITFFGTGLGLWKHDFQNQNGAITTAEDLPTPKKAVRVEIGGVPAAILYVGGAPGLVNAVVQFNVIIPALEPGDHELVVYSGDHPSKADVTIPVGDATAAVPE